MATAPKGATVPQDHQRSAAQIEAEGVKTATFTYAGIEYTVPAAPDDLDGEFLKYAADRDAYRMVATVLSDKQFATFRATKPKVGDYNGMSEKVAELYGFETVGN